MIITLYCNPFFPGCKEKFYEKFGLDNNLPTVLYVGRVDPEKNVGAVIDAFLKANLNNAQLAIVGDGVDVARLKKKYGEHKSVHFLGKIVPPELYDVYRMGDLFATASEIETQGIVLIEAAATGLPLIAVDAGAVSEVCVSGENGVLCRPGDVNEMAMAIRTGHKDYSQPETRTSAV